MSEKYFLKIIFNKFVGKYIKRIIILLILLASIFISCKSNENKEYPKYLVSVNKDLNCVELTYNSVTYRPFGVFTDNKLKGTQIGVRENSKNSKIYEIIGYSSNEWIVEYLEVLMGTNMILKGVNVKNIPAELEKFKEYDY